MKAARDLQSEFIDMRPAGGFDLIMADPPWAFRNFSSKGEQKNPSSHYQVAPLEWIASLPVSAIASRDCVLWLWATNPMLPQALQVIDAWGFTYKTAGHWVKRTVNGKLGFGTGYILRSAGEPFLIATRGNPKTRRNVRSVIEGQIREHSRKPDEAFEAAEMMMPEARRIELFSRQRRPGWECWGNETGRFEALDRASESGTNHHHAGG